MDREQEGLKDILMSLKTMINEYKKTEDAKSLYLNLKVLYHMASQLYTGD